MKKSIINLLVCIGIGVIGIFSLLYYQNVQNNNAIQTPVINPIVVESIKPTVQFWQSQIPLTGTLEAFQGVTIKSANTQGGIINQIYFKSGEEVKKGQPLFSIYPSKTVINAPFDGKLGLKQVDIGEYVSSGTSLVTLQQIDPLKVQFGIPQAYLADLSLGQQIDVSTTAYPNQIFQGKVYAIDNELDEDTRSIQVWAALSNKERKLFPGMFVEVVLYSNIKEKVLTVPVSTLAFSENGPYVYKIENNQAVRQAVKIGPQKDGQVQVLQGITLDDTLILAGQSKITNGSKVSIKNEGVKQDSNKTLTN